jgi:hypothetical protein
MYDYDDSYDFHYDSDAEWDRAEAAELGANNPDVAWICTDRDVWHANPYYHGPEIPHPDDPDGYVAPKPRPVTDADYDTPF